MRSLAPIVCVMGRCGRPAVVVCSIALLPHQHMRASLAECEGGRQRAAVVRVSWTSGTRSTGVGRACGVRSVRRDRGRTRCEQSAEEEQWLSEPASRAKRLWTPFYPPATARFFSLPNKAIFTTRR